MSSQLDKETSQLIKSFENPENASEVRNAQLVDPMEELGKDLFGFFRERISHIMKVSEFKEKVKEKILEKLQNNPDISFTEISNLFLSLTEQETIAAQQVMSLLKPPQGSTSNPFTVSFQNKDKPILNETKYDVETQRKIDTIYRFLEALDKKPEEKEIPAET